MRLAKRACNGGNLMNRLALSIVMEMVATGRVGRAPSHRAKSRCWPARPPATSRRGWAMGWWATSARRRRPNTSTTSCTPAASCWTTARRGSRWSSATTSTSAARCWTRPSGRSPRRPACRRTACSCPARTRTRRSAPAGRTRCSRKRSSASTSGSWPIALPTECAARSTISGRRGSPGARLDLPDQVFNRRWLMKPGTELLNPFGEPDQVKMNPGNSPNLLKPAGPVDPQIAFSPCRRSMAGRWACWPTTRCTTWAGPARTTSRPTTSPCSPTASRNCSAPTGWIRPSWPR